MNPGPRTELDVDHRPALCELPAAGGTPHLVAGMPSR
jgi:hypothetical protein